MNYKFTEFEAKKQELNCGVNTVPLIKYIESLYGYEKMLEIIEPLGLPISFLLNKRNWVSHAFYSALLEKLVEITGDEDAPYKVAFSMKPQSIFEDLYYSSFSTIFSTPKLVYKFIFNEFIETRFAKTGNSKILKSTKNSMTVKLVMKEGFKQNKYNCKAIQGFIALCPVQIGLPPAEITHTHCAAEGADSCIYIIKWKEKKRKYLFHLISLLILFLTIGIEITLFKNLINFKDIFLTILFYSIFQLSVKYIEFTNKIKNNEIFNFNRSNSLMDAMQKIEKDYNEILETKTKLEERNKFLSIINEINTGITEAYHYELLLNLVGTILLRSLDFDKGIYFKYNFSSRIFNSVFEINKNSSNESILTYPKISLSSKDRKVFFRGKKFKIDNEVILDIESSEGFKKWLDMENGSYYYHLPVEIPKIYDGFFVFVTKKSLLSDELTNNLFENISSQMKVGYQKISSKYIIDNILSSIPSNVVIFNIDNYEVRYINDMFVRFFPDRIKEFSSLELYGLSLFSIIPFSDEAKNNILDNLNKLLDGKTSETNEINIGSNVYEYNLFIIPQYKEGEKLIGLILTDVTEAKHYQQKLLLNEKLVALGKVASGIAHEINNPLYAILANAEEIADNPNLPADINKYASDMVNNVMNVSNIIKDLSAYSKTLRKEEAANIDLNNIIEESLKLVRYGSNFLQVKVNTALKDIPAIKATKGEMQQVFINLFNNAIQAMKGKGILTITTDYINDDTILIEISDTGDGIKEENIPKVFELFFTTKSPGEGTGQGLHIVKKILDLYGATIEFRTKEKEGTTFSIKFKVKDKIKSEVV